MMDQRTMGRRKGSNRMTFAGRSSRSLSAAVKRVAAFQDSLAEGGPGRTPSLTQVVWRRYIVALFRLSHPAITV